MLQLHLSDRQFYCLLRCVLYQRLDGSSYFSLYELNSLCDITTNHKNSYLKSPSSSHLDFESFGVEYMHLVPVATPDVFVSYDSHTADGMVGFAQVHQMVIGQVPTIV